MDSISGKDQVCRERVKYRPNTVYLSRARSGPRGTTIAKIDSNRQTTDASKAIPVFLLACYRFGLSSFSRHQILRSTLSGVLTCFPTDSASVVCLNWLRRASRASKSRWTAPEIPNKTKMWYLRWSYIHGIW